MEKTMPKVLVIDHPNDDQVKTVAYNCPGCNVTHEIRASESGANDWRWNGSEDKPTFSPSVKMLTGIRCHHYVKDGRIQFLHDCDHRLAGQTVELPDWDGVKVLDVESEIHEGLEQCDWCGGWFDLSDLDADYYCQECRDIPKGESDE